VAASPSRRLHPIRRRDQNRAELLVVHVAERDPGLQARGEEGLRLPHVSDARNECLVEERLAEGAALRSSPKADEHRVEVGRGGHDVRPESIGPAPSELKHRTAALNGLPFGAPEHEPGLAQDGPAGGLHVPAPVHAKVAPHDGAILEREQEVLADRLYALEAAAVDSLGNAEKRRARMRRVGAHHVSL